MKKFLTITIAIMLTLPPEAYALRPTSTAVIKWHNAYGRECTLADLPEYPKRDATLSHFDNALKYTHYLLELIALMRDLDNFLFWMQDARKPPGVVYKDSYGFVTHGLGGEMANIRDSINIIKQDFPNNMESVLKYNSILQKGLSNAKKLFDALADFFQTGLTKDDIARLNYKGTRDNPVPYFKAIPFILHNVFDKREGAETKKYVFRTMVMSGRKALAELQTHVENIELFVEQKQPPFRSILDEINSNPICNSMQACA